MTDKQKDIKAFIRFLKHRNAYDEFIRAFNRADSYDWRGRRYLELDSYLNAISTTSFINDAFHWVSNPVGIQRGEYWANQNNNWHYAIATKDKKYFFNPEINKNIKVL